MRNTQRPPRYHPVSSSVLFLLCRILKMCINRLRADQLDTFRLASALLPALLGDVKIVANNKKAISNAIEQLEKQMIGKMIMVVKRMHMNVNL
jgi:hypothetical protein